MTRVRIVYSDLDGTMVGPGGCFFRAEDRLLTLAPARALIALHEAGIALVLVSGRSRASLSEAANIFGADGYIGEMGAVLAWNHGREGAVLRGAMPDDLAGTPYDVAHELGAVDLLFGRYGERLAYHDPWHEGHEADVMLRGNIPVDEAEALLEGKGLGWLRLRDNGVLAGRAIPETGEPVHIYHLMPDGITKGLGVATDLARRGLQPDQAVAIGDSLSDLEMAPAVGRLYLTRNGLRGPATAAAVGELPNVTVTAGPVGAGWTEAVLAAVAT